MFEMAEVGRRVDKTQYQQEAPALRQALLDLQLALRGSPSSVIVIIEGVDNAIKGELANTLNDWLDTRGLEFQAFGPKSDEESERPRFWRYWRSLPARGRIGIFSGSWYSGTLYERTLGKLDTAHFELHMRRIARFENMLARDGAIILKFWLHMSRKQQKHYFRRLNQHGKGRWLISPLDQKLRKHYRAHLNAAEQTLRLTDQAQAPWHVIEAEDTRYRNLAVGQCLQAALRRTLAHADTPEPPAPDISVCAEPHTDLTQPGILDCIDLSLACDKETYEKRKNALLMRLNNYAWKAYHQGVSMVLVFEGWDAAGKGGAIRRLLRAIDARISQVIQISAPTDEERAHHYLWRFWRHLPRAGRITLYDRSWYGRVLVERVEGFASPQDWQNAYSEINDFEEQLCDHGILLLKFWLHISEDEQLRRFRERETTPHKRYKITGEDWRNRDKRKAYEMAAEDMVVRTSTSHAPWHLISANDKRHARLDILERICSALGERLEKE
ncbi:MAG: polyphosphate:AMP phosphotransferase [Gammaproteobacteria bacterium]|nr:polyphosphate:AMP phosphotransferase [Gammaproteobacteria bacterium]